MADIMDKATRSRVMGRIGPRNTAPEMTVRKALHADGLRYRVHVTTLPGKPDIVLPRWKAAIFVHGCFWHRHPGCRLSTMPATRRQFWAEKFAKNVARDERDRTKLTQLGWRVATVWECSLGTQEVDHNMARLIEWIRCGHGNVEFGSSFQHCVR